MNPPEANPLGVTAAKDAVLRNFAWNVVGRSWQILLSIATIPFLLSRLGTDVYGAYSLLGVFLVYFRFLNFGFSPAVERFSAAALARSDRAAVRSYYLTALWVQTAIAVLAAGIIHLVGRQLVGFLNAAPSLRPEILAALGWVAVSFLFSLVAGIPAGVLRAFQRFGLLNRISIVTGTLSTGLLVLAAWLDPTLARVAQASAAGALVTAVSHFVAAHRLVRAPLRLRMDRTSLSQLFRFGGILTLSSLFAPVLTNLEKVLTGVLLSMEAVSFYMVPYRILERFSMVPSALSRALFPHLSALNGLQDHRSGYRSALRATELLGWMLAPPFAFLLISGEELLTLWLGADFAAHSAPVLSILIAGWFVNLLGWNWVVVLQSSGRPGLQAMLYLVEIVLYAPLAWFLMERYGIVGAAAAWALRVLVDTVALWILGSWILEGSLRVPPMRYRAIWGGAAALGSSWLLTMLLGDGRVSTIVVGALISGVLLLVAWRVVLDPGDRHLLQRLLSEVISRVRISTA